MKYLEKFDSHESIEKDIDTIKDILDSFEEDYANIELGKDGSSIIIFKSPDPKKPSELEKRITVELKFNGYRKCSFSSELPNESQIIDEFNNNKIIKRITYLAGYRVVHFRYLIKAMAIILNK